MEGRGSPRPGRSTGWPIRPLQASWSCCYSRAPTTTSIKFSLLPRSGSRWKTICRLLPAPWRSRRCSGVVFCCGLTGWSEDQLFPPSPSVPGPPAPGPWDQAMGRDSAVLYTELAGLPSPPEPRRRRSGRFLFPDPDPRAGHTVGLPGRLEPRPRAAWDNGAHGRRPGADPRVTHDVAQRRRERSLEEATQDLLTGLGNRRGYFQALDSRVAAGDRPALMYIDIDGFKDVNDRLGRLAGDSALRVDRPPAVVGRAPNRRPRSRRRRRVRHPLAPVTSPSLRSSQSRPVWSNVSRSPFR